MVLLHLTLSQWDGSAIYVVMRAMFMRNSQATLPHSLQCWGWEINLHKFCPSGNRTPDSQLGRQTPSPARLLRHFHDDMKTKWSSLLNRVTILLYRSYYKKSLAQSNQNQLPLFNLWAAKVVIYPSQIRHQMESLAPSSVVQMWPHESVHIFSANLIPSKQSAKQLSHCMAPQQALANTFQCAAAGLVLQFTTATFTLPQHDLERCSPGLRLQCCCSFINFSPEADKFLRPILVAHFFASLPSCLACCSEGRQSDRSTALQSVWTPVVEQG